MEKNVYNNVKNNYSTILMLNSSEDGNGVFENMKPGETRSKEIDNITKVLSNNENDLVFNNDIEILEEKNTVGRVMNTSTPGNYIPNSSEEIAKELDCNGADRNMKSTITVVPPTGQTRIYYILGGTCLLILLAGVLIIKKKILDQ